MTDIQDIKRLAGITQSTGYTVWSGSNISLTGMEKKALEKKHDIQPGTPEWFQLWFSRPYLTGEAPISK